MIGRNDPLRLSQTALTRAGKMKLARAVKPGENLAGLLKYMAERSAVATGRTRHRRTTADRRRYGDFILVLKGHVLVDLIAIRHDWCQTCLGTGRDTTCTCTTT